MTWNIAPLIFEYGSFKLSWYGLFFASGCFLGFKIMQWIYGREGRDVQELDRLLWFVLGGTVIGMRLVHCLVYEPDYYLAHPFDIPKVWMGGYASHGGAIGVLLGVWLYCRRAGSPAYLWVLDRLAIPAVIAGAFIRIGNFFNSEIYGNPTDSPFGIVFERVDNVSRHPTQLYEAIAYFVIFGILMAFYRSRSGRNRIQRDGWLTGWYLLLIFVARFFLEFTKAPQATYEAGFAISVGQYLSIPFVLAGIFLLLYSYRRPAAQKPL